MAYLVGEKGQIVIDRRIRERLGIERGWQAIQRLVDEHVEIHFLPPEHGRSLAGCLAPYVKRTCPDEESLASAREAAWTAVARRRMSDGGDGASEEGGW
jgi:bifunctional DNA-binding transcriptional regulator/antitoxin component of YhaV-PrlF toxin-antitoxin module